MLSTMAWRNLWRNRRRSLITLSAMVFGLFTCLVIFAVGDGAHNQMVRVATSTYIGHIQVNRHGFHEQQKLEMLLRPTDRPVKLIQQAVGEKKGPTKARKPWQGRIKSWSPRAFGAGLVSTGKHSSGGFYLGMDFVRESRVTRIPESVLKAMAQEALRTGQYKNRLPTSYLLDIQKRYKKLLPPQATHKVKQEAMRKALHQATQALARNRSAYESTLSKLLQQGEVAIGKGLASSLKAKVGSPLAVIAKPYQGLISNDRYKVVAIVESGNPDMDMSLCVMPIKQLQELLYLGPAFHTMVLQLNTTNGREIRSVAQQLAQQIQPQPKVTTSLWQTWGYGSAHAKTALSSKPQWEVLPWQKVSPELYEFINADESSQFVVTIIVFFLVAFIILNTLQMSLLERTREFGVLRSLGMKGHQLIALVLWEGLFLGLVATALGYAFGLPVMTYLQQAGIPLAEPLRMGGILLDLRLEAQITMQGLLFAPAVVILTTLVVSLFPAFRAAKLKPVEALRHI